MIIFDAGDEESRSPVLLYACKVEGVEGLFSRGRHKIPCVPGDFNLQVRLRDAFPTPATHR